jgi:hypothetical protein
MFRPPPERALLPAMVANPSFGITWRLWSVVNLGVFVLLAGLAIYLLLQPGLLLAGAVGLALAAIVPLVMLYVWPIQDPMPDQVAASHLGLHLRRRGLTREVEFVIPWSQVLQVVPYPLTRGYLIRIKSSRPHIRTEFLISEEIFGQIAPYLPSNIDRGPRVRFGP